MPRSSQDDYIRTLDCALEEGQPAPDCVFHAKG